MLNYDKTLIVCECGHVKTYYGTRPVKCEKCGAVEKWRYVDKYLLKEIKDGSVY